MELGIRAYRAEDLPAMINIWNEVVEDGIAFPLGGTAHAGERSGILRGAELYRCS